MNIKKFFCKKLIYSLILFILLAILLGNMNTYAVTTYTYNSNYNNLPSDFDNLYPGYKTLLEDLADSHPNWTFRILKTDLEWETVINNEYQGHGSSPKNLVPANSSNYSGGWICPICGNKGYDTGNWYCASREAIEYMMDPRNSINESDIFQFQDLSSSTGDRSAIESMVRGTFINTNECIDAIFEAATRYNVSPYHLVSRIIQEQGTGGSTLGLGIEKNGITYYNLFNVGAAGNTSSKVIENGLNRAIDEGWTSMAKSIIGGAEFLVKNYISVGQCTAYFQKFNVVNTNNLYGHQYMQNILAAQNEGITMKNKYKNYGILESSFTFLIPLYNNMPDAACSRPLTNSSLEEGELVTVNATGGLALRDSPNGSTLCYIADGTVISRIEKATNKVGSYYWDKVSTPKGTGYMAREASDGSKTYLVPVEPEIEIDYSINNNFSEPDENGIIYTEPNTTVEKLKEKYNEEEQTNEEESENKLEIKVVDSEGAEISGNILIGTGAKIIINGVETYTIVKLGDVNGDGNITSADYVRLKNYLRNIVNLSEEQKLAADPTRDGSVTSADYVRIKNYIRKKASISI